MIVNTSTNSLKIDVELSDPLNPIVIDGINHFPVNQIVNLEVTELRLDGVVMNLSDYIIGITIKDPDYISFSNNITATKLGTYTTTIQITEIATFEVYSIILQYEVVNAITIETADCEEFTVTNYNLFPVNMQVLDAFTDEEIAPLQEVDFESMLVIRFSEVSFYKIIITYDNITQVYLANTYCKLNQCISSFITATLCGEGEPCKECPDSIDLNRVLGLNYILLAKINSLYGKNNFYSSLENVPALDDIENVLSKLKSYCERIGCIGQHTSNNLANTHTHKKHGGCGCK